MSANPADLFTVQELLAWSNTGQQGDQTRVSPIAQDIITGLSQAVYWACGRTVPMLSAQTAFTETYNGSGSDVLYLLNAPVLSVGSLTVNGVAFPASTAYGQAGYFVQQDAKSIALRSGATSGYPFVSEWGWRSGYKFARGRGNVLITYTAGYDGCPPDLYLALLKHGTFFLNKRLREDLASTNIPAAGTDSYRGWAMSPDVQLLLQPYIRTAMVNIFGAA